MARDAMKAAGNPWYQARLNASMYDDRLKSREGAAERLGMSVSAVADAELGLSKVMPVDKAVLMADAYNAPHLLNYYCLHECPIGCRRPMSDADLEIDRLTVKLLKNLKISQVTNIKEKLLDIAEDGIISDDEKPDLREVMEYLDELARVLTEMQTLSQRVLNGG